jgi:hypothetical protein
MKENSSLTRFARAEAANEAAIHEMQKRVA